MSSTAQIEQTIIYALRAHGGRGLLWDEIYPEVAERFPKLSRMLFKA